MTSRIQVKLILCSAFISRSTLECITRSSLQVLSHFRLCNNYKDVRIIPEFHLTVKKESGGYTVKLAHLNVLPQTVDNTADVSMREPLRSSSRDLWQSTANTLKQYCIDIPGIIPSTRYLSCCIPSQRNYCSLDYYEQNKKTYKRQRFLFNEKHLYNLLMIEIHLLTLRKIFYKVSNQTRCQNLSM